MVFASDAIRSIAREIYGEDAGQAASERIDALLAVYDTPDPSYGRRFSEADVVLITYGDALRSDGRIPLQTLHDFATQYLKESFSAIHFLPFFPYSSDDGFSVIDYVEINRDIGSWPDVERFGLDFDLMFDYVLNHISAQSPWFKNYLAGT